MKCLIKGLHFRASHLLFKRSEKLRTFSPAGKKLFGDIYKEIN